MMHLNYAIKGVNTLKWNRISHGYIRLFNALCYSVTEPPILLW